MDLFQTVFSTFKCIFKVKTSNMYDWNEDQQTTFQLTTFVISQVKRVAEKR